MTQDVDRLLGWFAGGSLVRPDARVPGTVHLAHAVASPYAGAPAPDPSSAQIARAIGEAAHFVFVLVDGLGMNLIESLPPGSFFRSHLALELQSVFPSSTAPALSAIATGCWPAEHAVTGWWTYLPDAGVTSTILPFIERFGGRPLVEHGVTPASALPVESILSRYPRPASWMPAEIANSTYTRYFNGATPAHAYDRISDACAQIAERIGANDGPSYTYLYIPHVDNAQHEHGPLAHEVRESLLSVERSLARLASGLPDGARVIITADHGQIGISERAQTVITPGDPLLQSLLVPPTGDYRSLFFHTRPGAAGTFAAAFRDRFGESWALLTTDEVDELRLLGPEPLAPETRRRIGDFTAIGPGAEAICYLPESRLLGFHGGLRPEEMRIPLIVA